MSKMDYLKKDSIILSAEEEKAESNNLKQAYFLTQKTGGKIPGVIQNIQDIIRSKNNFENGSLTVSIKNTNNTLPEFRPILGTNGRHVSSSIKDITKEEAGKLSEQLKADLKANFKNIDSLLKTLKSESNIDEVNLLRNEISTEVQRWELTPQIRLVFLKKVRKITQAFRSLSMKGNRLIRDNSKIRYESVVVDLFSKKTIPGLKKEKADEIKKQLSNEVSELESLCQCSIGVIINDVQQLYKFNRKFIEAQNKLTLSCEKVINYKVNIFAQRNGLSNEDQDDLLQDMRELMITQALYNFDGRFRLSTYIQDYLKQCVTKHSKKSSIITTRSKLKRSAKLYYKARDLVETTNPRVTDQMIADKINEIDPSAKATVALVQEFFYARASSLETTIINSDGESSGFNFENDDNLNEISPSSPYYNTEDLVYGDTLEHKAFNIIKKHFSPIDANIFALRHGLFNTSPYTYESLEKQTGFTKESLRRKLDCHKTLLSNKLNSIL